MAVFQKFKSLNIKCGHRNPKRHIFGRNVVFLRIFVKIRLGVYRL